MRTLAITILALTLGAAFGHAEAEFSSYIKTNRYDFKITDADMAGTPVWKEQDDHPPLAARKALAAARSGLAQIVSDHKDWTLEGLTLQQWHDGSHWYYLAVFNAPVPPGVISIGRPVSMTIPVLMNGAAVKPKVSPRPK